LASLGLVLTLTVTPSVFTVDDLNYLVTVLAAREGHVTVANTQGLTPSRELLFFDPTVKRRAVPSTPVAPTTPALYGLIAVPFSWFGWRGLVGLNTLAYLATVWIVFVYTRAYAVGSAAPWIAAAAFALGGYAIEYAQGLWPHALSFALCTAGILAAGRVIDDERPRLAMASGLLLGIAAGVRYQNAVIVAAVGVGILVLAQRRRWRAALVYALGAMVPIATGGLINHARLDSWNPISKGPYYLSVPVDSSLVERLHEAVVMFWSQLFDYSMRPPLAGVENLWVSYGPVTGAHLILGLSVKKAFLQSAPWAVLSLLVFAMAWLRRFHDGSSCQRQLRLQAVVTAAVVAAFAVAGTSRHDGLSFNARYLLELLPLAAVAFAWSVDDRLNRTNGLGEGILCGALLVIVILLGTPPGDGERSGLSIVRHFAVLKIPLLLAGCAAVLSWLDRAGYAVRVGLMAVVGTALGWGLTLHLLDDVMMARGLRSLNLSRTEAYQWTVPDHSGVVAYWGNKDFVGPLLLSRDIVVIDVHPDEGRDAPMLIRELLGKGRRVFLLKDGFPVEMLDRILSDLRVKSAGPAESELIEVF
jgi:hypothetical protein